jgi:hypothetical protein
MAETTTTTLTYHVPPKENARPYLKINADPKTGQRETNIENIRGKEDTVGLDTTGFQYLKRAAKHTTFGNDEEIKKEYYPESAKLIKEVTGASRVVFFDHSMSPFHLLQK